MVVVDLEEQAATGDLERAEVVLAKWIVCVPPEIVELARRGNDARTDRRADPLTPLVNGSYRLEGSGAGCRSVARSV